MHRQRARTGLFLLVFLAAGSSGSAQETLTPGVWSTGTLEATDPVDADSFVYDAYLLPQGLEGLVSVTVESADFDAYLEWGVMGGGEFIVVAQNDDFPGLTSETDARTYALVGPGERPEIRVFSLEGGPDGAYRVRIDLLEQAAPDAASIAYGADVEGALEESDAFVDGTFVDRFLVAGAQGDVLKVALEADFDAYLRLYGPDGELLAEDDDGLFATDAYLEVELPADGSYRVEATSFMPGLGTYRLRLGTELDVGPMNPPVEIMITAEERDGLQYSGEGVWNDAMGFSLPSPGADFTLVPADEVEALMGEGAPNVHMWMFQDVMETAQLLIMVIKAGQAVDASMLDMISGMMVQSTGAEILEETSDWEGSRSTYTRFTVGAEDAEIRCMASPEDRSSGLIVCVMGASTDGWSFREVLDGLEVR
ncbi:MAG TPA: hypothetical protein VLA43_16425 [Longimicrobiales bacterium]|nr:hypothetical protein [Longimicrobiales bacterium]